MGGKKGRDVGRRRGREREGATPTGSLVVGHLPREWGIIIIMTTM